MRRERAQDNIIDALMVLVQVLKTSLDVNQGEKKEPPRSQVATASFGWTTS